MFLLLDKIRVACYYYFVNPERGFLISYRSSGPDGNHSPGVVGAKPSPMIRINNYFKNRLNSFILLPLLLTNITNTGLVDKTLVSDSKEESVISLNLQIFKDIKVPEVIVVDPRAEKIDAYFAQWDLPLAGHGKGMIEAADKYGIDWRLLPALAMLETTGGKNLCGNGTNLNAFGYGSCKIHFSTFEESFDAVAKTISGNGEKTSHLYKGKSVEGILEVYNPPGTPGMTVGYHKKALRVMSEIENMAVDSSLLAQA